METNESCGFKVALHTVDKRHKCRGRNSLRGEGCNNPTLAHIYLIKSSLIISLIIFVHLPYHVY